MKNKTKTAKKLLALVLSLMMIVTAVPMMASASATETTYRSATDKYGTPYWTPNWSDCGTNDANATIRWMLWGTEGDTSDHVKVYYPAHIYLDKSETLQSAGYQMKMQWHYGNGTDYRVCLSGSVWGDYRNYTGKPDKYYTMTNMFSDYGTDTEIYSSSNVKGAGNEWGVNGYKDDNSYDLCQNTGYKNFTPATIWRCPNGASNLRNYLIFLKGTPKGTGTGQFNTSGSGANSYCGFMRWGNSWKHTTSYTNKGTSSYNEGQWAEIAWNVTIYDKAELQTEIDKARNIVTELTSNGGYVDLERSGRLNEFLAQLTEAEDQIKIREQEQSDIDAEKTALTNVSKAIYVQASDTAMLNSYNTAKNLMATSDYTTKYTQASRDALAAAVAQVESAVWSNAYTLKKVYPYSTSSLATELADVRTEQNLIDNLKASVDDALAALTNQYLVTFEKYDGTVVSSEYYPVNTAVADIVVPSENTAMTYDADNHYTYSWPTVETVTATVTYKEVQTAEAHKGGTSDCSNKASCEVCGQEYGDFGAHSLTEVAEVPATCGADGTAAHYKCTLCDKLFSHDDSSVEVEEADLVLTSRPAHTDANDDCICDVCSSALNHQLVKVDKVPQNCGVDGTDEHYKCSVCGKLFTDEAGMNETTLEALKLNATGAHTGGTATCQQKAVCEVCGQEYGELGAHSLGAVAEVPATCGKAGVMAHYACTLCGAKFMDADGNTAATDADLTIDATGAHTWSYTTNGEANHTKTCSVCSTTQTEAHAWVAGEVKTPATCTETGVQAYACSLCNQEKDQTINALGHDFTEQLVDADHLRSAANCQYAATYWYDCSRCDVKSTDKYFFNGGKDASNHTGPFRDVTGQPATCYQTGYTDYQICDGCNKAVGYTILNKTAHTFEATTSNNNGTHSQVCSVCRDANRPVYTYTADCTYEWVVDANATCGNGGTKHQECTTCGYVLPGSETEIPATGEHNYTDVVTAPTCTTDGYTTHTCSVCGHSYTDTVVAATGHSYAEYVPTNDDTPVTVANCVDKATYYKKCSVCGAVGTETFAYGEVDASNHKTVVTIEKVDSTCQTAGHEAYDYCEACKTNVTEPVEIAVKAHTYGTLVSNGDGTHTATCTTCDSDVATPATKTEDCSGGTANCVDKAVCTECNTAYGEVDASNHKTVVTIEKVDSTCQTVGHEAYDYCEACKTNVTEPKEIAKKAHTPATREEKRVEASCGTDGSYDLVTYCSVCKEVLSTEHKTITATGEHNYATEVEGTKTPATCVAEGSVTMSCGCGATKVVTLPIDSTNHANVVTDAAVAATCTATGLTEGSHCAACNTVIVAQTVIPAKGHAWGEWTVEKAASCTKKGSEKRVCANDASHVETRETEMAAHTEEILPAVEATCTATGLTEGKKCSVCGTILVAQTEVAMKDHTPAAAVQENVVPATCTAKGSYESVVYCSVCKKELSRTPGETGMIDHTPSDWIVDGEASCATGGTKHKECTVCHTVLETGTIPATGVHTYVDVVTAPTCVAQGYTTHTCSVCGNSYVDSYVDALGHTEVTDAAKEATCTETGLTEGKHCSVCGEVIVAQTEIPALGHNYGDGVLTRPTVVDGAWVDGYYTYTCKRDAAHTYTETAPRANYTEYDKLVSDINNAIASGDLTQDAIDALNATLTDNAVADNLIDSEQAIVDAAASALKDALDAAAGALKPDFTAIDEALGKYDDADAVVDVPTDVANRIDEIKDIINDIKNDPNATRADKQDDIDALVDEVNGYVSHLAECAKGNHEYEAGWTIDIEATCAHSGWKSHHCAYCGATTARPEYDADGVEIPKLAHSVTSWTETKAPTCIAEGEKTGTCDLCGTSVTEAVAKLGHNWGAWVRTKNSTCIEKGKETRTCDRCGETQTRELPLVGHHIVAIPGVEPTCDEPGKTSGEYCDVCGKVVKEQKEIPARGHLDTDGDGKCDACDRDYDGECECMCHNDTLWSKIVRFIYTLFSKIFRKRIACCEDMVFWGGEIKDLT